MALWHLERQYNGSQQSTNDQLHPRLYLKSYLTFSYSRYFGGLLEKDVWLLSSHFEKALNGVVVVVAVRWIKDPSTRAVLMWWALALLFPEQLQLLGLTRERGYSDDFRCTWCFDLFCEFYHPWVITFQSGQRYWRRANRRKTFRKLKHMTEKNPLRKK